MNIPHNSEIEINEVKKYLGIPAMIYTVYDQKELETAVSLIEKRHAYGLTGNKRLSRNSGCERNCKHIKQAANRRQWIGGEERHKSGGRTPVRLLGNEVKS